MKRNTDFITKDLARRIYLELEKGERGEIPFPDYKIEYYIKSRKTNNLPAEVSLDVLDEEGYRVDMFLLKYGEGFSDFTVSQDTDLY